ncbi:MAG: bifunctional glutamate N-acetyltransferase/amino-acid acetyltransferase ArgJ [Eubacteriales bacterium]|nr:bifunctional glutamate N-acetyltransferase/amino-acid acetyltransferase ArgJ [Eubacteriales bacterium]MDD4583393.1 bifunctional glutamate N-acetyltransferase/amino-acid acetyltransferase ArgJ [Eubacteriales bacterium]
MENKKKGVCAPQGFLAAGIHSGIKREKNDLALVFCKVPCVTAAVYTSNQVKAAPLYVTMEHLKDGKAQAVIANSGNANCCAPFGRENAVRMARAVAEAVGIQKQDVIVASTGIIGVPLEIEKIEKGIPSLVNALSEEGSSKAAEAIMTTDTYKKECAVDVILNGKTVKIGGISKGSGMIHPNMGTTLTFLTTDVNIEQNLLQKALQYCVKRSFNRISIDGDTSTNDMACLMASGLAANSLIEKEDSQEYATFVQALLEVCTHLARELARDGEGSTRLISCTVCNGESEDKAEIMAKAIIASTLTKAAMFGGDANWGRILCAMGYSGVPFDFEKTDLYFKSVSGEIKACENGRSLPFDNKLAKIILSEEEIHIIADLKEGKEKATAWGCDLTYEYVKINGMYRS